MRKGAFCIWENNGADQLYGNRTADQHLCFCCIDSTTALPGRLWTWFFGDYSLKMILNEKANTEISSDTDRLIK